MESLAPLMLGACLFAGVWLATRDWRPSQKSSFSLLSMNHIQRIRRFNSSLEHVREKARTTHRIIVEGLPKEIFAGSFPESCALPIVFVWNGQKMDYQTFLFEIDSISLREETLLLITEAIHDYTVWSKFLAYHDVSRDDSVRNLMDVYVILSTSSASCEDVCLEINGKQQYYFFM